MSTELVVTIMAGGAGTRFWPLSTEEKPKQFLAITGERSLLQLSYDRVIGLVGPQRILVLTNERYVDLVRQQLPELPEENVVGEPCRRDTAAAVCLASLLTEARFGSTAVMAVVTADHVIGPIEEFHKAISEAEAACSGGGLYTLGIEPKYPATGFGYLEMGEALTTGELSHFQLKSFKEKPDRSTAEHFLSEGRFYWNSGMFVWTVTSILKEFETHLPEHLEILRPAIDSMEGTEGWKGVCQAFARLSKISVDYAILEKAEDVRTVIPRIDWDDVGGWLAIAKYLETDSCSNSVNGTATLVESEGNICYVADPTEEIVLVGVRDMVVVREDGRTLIVHKDKLDRLKAAVASLNS